VGPNATDVLTLLFIPTVQKSISIQDLHDRQVSIDLKRTCFFRMTPERLALGVSGVARAVSAMAQCRITCVRYHSGVLYDLEMS
jgi:hypothetical protein